MILILFKYCLNILICIIVRYLILSFNLFWINVVLCKSEFISGLLFGFIVIFFFGKYLCVIVIYLFIKLFVVLFMLFGL